MLAIQLYKRIITNIGFREVVFIVAFLLKILSSVQKSSTAGDCLDL